MKDYKKECLKTKHKQSPISLHSLNSQQQLPIKNYHPSSNLSNPQSLPKTPPNLHKLKLTSVKTPLIVIITLLTTLLSLPSSISQYTSLSQTNSLPSFSQPSPNQFTQSATCQFNTPDNYVYDLSKMRKSTFDYRFDYMKYSYRANFCGPLVQSCNASPTPAALFLRRGVCVGKFTKYWSNVRAEYLDNDIKTNGLKLFFESGERCVNAFNMQFTLNFTIKCDPSQFSKLETVKKVTACHYDFVFSSQFGCPTASGVGSASQSLLFWLCLFFAIYLALFTYLNYRVNPEDGFVKALPHREFWMEFAENAVLGYRFSFEFARSKVEFYYDRYKERRANSG